MRGAIVKQRGSSKNHILTHSKHVGRIRALIKKAPARKNAVEINDAILTVATATSVLCHHRKSVDFSITSSVHSSLPKHLGSISKRPARFSSSHNIGTDRIFGCLFLD
jgi:hypothetical protein